MIRAHLVISEAGRVSLACAGISTAWLSLWIKSAGAEHVDVHTLNDVNWEDTEGWIVVIADDVDLMRVALAHGKRILADHDGKRTLLGSDTFFLGNPRRTAWFYKYENSRVLLLPTGDVAYQRFTWLGKLNHEQPLLPLLVSTDGKAGDVLEPGLFGSIDNPYIKQNSTLSLNDRGYLLEEQLILLLKKYRMKLRCAESCTAGGITARISRVPGASNVLDRSWVSYSNESKQEELGISSVLIEKYGAVSRQVVEAMAAGCIKNSSRKKKFTVENIVSIAVTGIAGPDGGTETKPVGTVWIAIQLPGEKPMSACFCLSGNRTDIQSLAATHALAMLIREVDQG